MEEGRRKTTRYQLLVVGCALRTLPGLLIVSG